MLCVLASALLWFVIEKLRANPIIAGLGLTGLGLGGTDLAVQAIYGSQASVNAPYGLPRLGPEFGAFGVLSVLVVLMPFVVFGVWVLVRRTRWGLQLTACGEHPFAARSVGVNPSRMRLCALCLGGVLCAIGGAELSMGSLQIFAYGMTAGRGFMAFAAVIFGAANPIGATGAAFFFAIVGALGIRAQLLFGDRVPHDLLLGASLHRHRDRRLDQRQAARRRQGGDRLRRAARLLTETRNLEFAQRHAISDVCVLVEDIERSIAFLFRAARLQAQASRRGLRRFHRRRADAGALGDRPHQPPHRHLEQARPRRPQGLHCRPAADAGRCRRLPRGAELRKASSSSGPPADYPWNARCCYFAGPDDELWELYAWRQGGAVGAVAAGS